MNSLVVKSCHVWKHVKPKVNFFRSVVFLCASLFSLNAGYIIKSVWMPLRSWWFDVRSPITVFFYQFSGLTCQKKMSVTVYWTFLHDVRCLWVSWLSLFCFHDWKNAFIAITTESQCYFHAVAINCSNEIPQNNCCWPHNTSTLSIRSY